MLCCVESIKLMKIDKYAVQVQGVHQPSSFLNLLPEGPQLPVMTSQIIHKIKVRKITLINVNTYPVPKISKYLNLIIFDEHNLSSSYKISNSLGLYIPFLSKDLSEDPGLSFWKRSQCKTTSGSNTNSY